MAGSLTISATVGSSMTLLGPGPVIATVNVARASSALTIDGASFTGRVVAAAAGTVALRSGSFTGSIVPGANNFNCSCASGQSFAGTTVRFLCYFFPQLMTRLCSHRLLGTLSISTAGTTYALLGGGLFTTSVTATAAAVLRVLGPAFEGMIRRLL